MKRFIFITIIVLLVSGCASTGYNNSYYSGIYQLKLNQPITVQAGSSYAYIKAPGQVVLRKEIGTYDLYCKIAVPRPKDSDELIISPDEFEINGIHRRNSGLYNHQPYTFQLAYNGGYGGLFRHHDASKQDLELYINLHSINQPQIKSLSCIRFADPYFGNTPSVSEVKKVLQGLAELVTAE